MLNTVRVDACHVSVGSQVTSLQTRELPELFLNDATLYFPGKHFLRVTTHTHTHLGTVL